MTISQTLREWMGLWVPLAIAGLAVGVGVIAPKHSKPRPQALWVFAPAAIPRCRLTREAEEARREVGICSGCHNLYPGPDRKQYVLDLHDIYGERAGTHSLQYHHVYYRPLIAARNRGLVWTSENLEGYLKGPEAFLKSATGVSYPDWQYPMGYSIPGDDPQSVQRRRDIAEYLKEVKGQPCD